MLTQMKDSWEPKLRQELLGYGAIPDEEWNKLMKMVRLVRLKKDQHFIRIGDVPDKLGFISSGIFRIFFITDQGDEKILAFRRKNQLLSAFSQFLQGKPSWCGIQALTESLLLCINLKEYNQLLSDHPCWNILGRKYLENLFIEKEKREREFLSEDATARYLSFRQNNPGLEDKISQYHIASYLGITPVALSRIRKNLKERPTS
jgi:CRP-like cAMP-binding protein